MASRLMRRVAIACGTLALAGTLAAPNAMAQSSDQLSQQVLAPLAQLNPEVAGQVQAALDQAQLGSSATLEEQIAALAEQFPVETPFELEPLPNGPFYEWTNDPFSKVMALQTGPVLHRVTGSFFHGPDVPQVARDAHARGTTLYGPGTPILVNDESMCTVAVTGTDAQGRKLAITAGHCGEVGQPIKSLDAVQLGNNAPSGTIVRKGQDLDYAVIELGPNTEITSEYYPGFAVHAVGAEPRALDTACKQGVASNNSCGPVLLSDPEYAISHVCARPGDSGGPLIEGDRVVGIISGGIIPTELAACNTPLQGPLHSPTATVNMEAVLRDLNTGGTGVGFQPA
ncbi:S1 family peptidase [Corynebacterium gerontici]|uniref:Peptidase S1 domain-containing protein n=1 Tax=Corynebacterium gerontici TaxID=2079234 RepID=A0A3G6IZ31_9CORY|nr:S1 family peptidase [Corynebacterium gerontici]AZA10916.1 hypothetical protein CGERO_02965 [Corynebacterium gerontici]